MGLTLKAQPFSKQTGNGNRNLFVSKKNPYLYQNKNKMMKKRS